jgi:hypothetical protein
MNHMILPNGEYAVGKFIPEGSILVPPKPSGPYSWNDTEWIFDGYTPEDAMNRLRFNRNRLLAQSDWMANSDVTMTEEWRVYRQALRDLPNTQTPSLDENGQLNNITWPEKPQ